MSAEQQNIMIQRLPIGTINRIAAGEVVERPASVVRELIDNALDAKAKDISVYADNGGLSLVRVVDDGHGMSARDMELAIERHTTSKLDAGDNPDLMNIKTFGFRGEALPSIGSVSRLRIVSRADGSADCHEILVEGGQTQGVSPAAWQGIGAHGTDIEVRDLFFSTPARLKFMKSEKAEIAAISAIVRDIAMSHPATGFLLNHNGRKMIRLKPDTAIARLTDIMGKEFTDNAIPIEAQREGIRISGYAGLPTLNLSTARQQYLYVNNRPVKDRMLIGIIRAAYQDFLARDRHPMLVLFIDIDSQLIDVNVHPAKTEIRFRRAEIIRGLCIGALRHALAGGGHRASTTIASAALGAVKPGMAPIRRANIAALPDTRPALIHSAPAATAPAMDEPEAQTATTKKAPPEPDYPLGAARAQLHETYIVSQTSDGIIIVDQHAAHERLVMERMKQQYAQNAVHQQMLLVPEIVEMSEITASRLLSRAEELRQFGLDIEPFGPGCVIVKATPSMFGEMDAKGLVNDLAAEIEEYGEGVALKEQFAEIVGNMACRSAIRAGRRMNGAEMNALLRQMEATAYSGQCNHGRPTYVELKLADIERLFGRR